jgi:hypothetical protein
MSVGTELSPGQARILARAMLAESDQLTIGQAQYLVELDLPVDDFARMNQLAEKASEGNLTTEETGEVEDYMQVGNLLEELKSRARKTLRDAGLDTC